MHSFLLGGIQLCLDCTEVLGVGFLHTDPGPSHSCGSRARFESKFCSFTEEWNKRVLTWAVPYRIYMIKKVLQLGQSY